MTWRGPSLGRIGVKGRRRRLALAAVVRGRRKAAGLSQQALGEAAGWDRQVVCRFEGGHYSPTVDRLWRLADALGCPLSTLAAEAETLLDRPRRTGDKTARKEGPK